LLWTLILTSDFVRR